MSIKLTEKIYVNRSLNFASVRAIGFDMDHTLAVYNHINFEELAFKCTLQKFVDNGYPEELALLKFDPSWVVRGLLVDRERGNILKVDGHNYVKYAYHGKKALTRDERRDIYNSKKFNSDSFLSLDTLFSLSEVQLFIELVEFMDRNKGRINKSYLEVSKDIRKYIDLCHADGSIKNLVIQKPAEYLIRDKHLNETLIKLKDSGKCLFVLTNSDLEYTDKIMTFLLNTTAKDGSLERHWSSYFDFIFISAGKPKFFADESILSKNVLEQAAGGVSSTNVSGVVDTSVFAHQRIYVGGSVELLQKTIGFLGSEILYVGDHIYGDIITSKGKVNWRTLLIIEELEREINHVDTTRDLLSEIIELVDAKEQVDEKAQILRTKANFLKSHIERDEANGHKSKVAIMEKDLEKTLLKLHDVALELTRIEDEIRRKSEERDRRIHPIWGELMKVGLEKSRFARQVITYACLYTSRVTNMRFYSPFRTFISSYEKLPHEQ